MMEQDKKKAAAIMLEMDFATDSDLYKMVYSTLMKNCAKFMLYSNTKQKPESSTYNSLQKIESMLEGYDDVMAYYIEQLLNNNQKPHAKMLFQKNEKSLKPLLDQKILDKLSQIPYNSMFDLEK